MGFQVERGVIHWKVHFNSPCETVYAALTTNEGRASFWAESAQEENGAIIFNILGYKPSTARILESQRSTYFKLEYFGTIVEFTLLADDTGGTELMLKASQVDESIRMEMAAGWVSVLMAMKASVDHGVDLRNHNAARTWNLGYADN